LDKVSWDLFAGNANMSDVFFERYLDGIDWYKLSTNTNLYAGGNCKVNGGLTVSGLLNQTGNVNIGSTLTVGGNTLLNAGLVVAADVSMNDRLFVSDDVSFNNRLYVGDRATIRGALTVTGATTTNSDVQMNNKLNVTNDVSMNSKLFVNNDVSMNSKLTVGKDATINGNIIVNATTPSVSTSTGAVIINGGMGITGNVNLTNAFGLIFSTTSDYRVNNNVVNLGDNYTVDNLRPVSYYNTLRNSDEMGFLAHEVQSVYPYLVNGNKNKTQSCQGSPQLNQESKNHTAYFLHLILLIIEFL
jgi:predicted acyltransferase (DUF342 family)